MTGTFNKSLFGEICDFKKAKWEQKEEEEEYYFHKVDFIES